MKKTYAIVNFLSVLLVLAVNGLSQAQRWNDTTIGEASDKYENLFTPAGYAFSIWGVIFLMLLGYSLFQIRRAFFSKKESPFIVQTGWWFAIANFLNAASSKVSSAFTKPPGRDHLFFCGVIFLLISKTFKAFSSQSILKQTTLTAFSDSGYLLVMKISIQRLSL